jgi:hypothetical protein
LSYQQSNEAEVAAVPELTKQPPINPWSNMWNWMQAESFKTFLDLKNNLGSIL